MKHEGTLPHQTSHSTSKLGILLRRRSEISCAMKIICYHVALRGSRCINQRRADHSRVSFIRPLCVSVNIRDIRISVSTWTETQVNSIQSINKCGGHHLTCTNRKRTKLHSTHQVADSVAKFQKAQPRHVISDFGL